MERKIIVITPETFISLFYLLLLAHWLDPVSNAQVRCFLKSLINHTGFTAVVRIIGTVFLQNQKFINHTGSKALNSIIS
jgi:hypothetical protein